MDANVRSQINSIIDDINSIIRDLNRSADDLYEFQGIRAEHCSSKLRQIAAKYDQVKNKLNELQ